MAFSSERFEEMRKNLARINTELDEIALEHLKVYLRLKGPEKIIYDVQNIDPKGASRIEIPESPIEPEPWGGYVLRRPLFSAPLIGLAVQTTTREFEVLATLVRAKGEVRNRVQLGALDESDRTVDATVSLVRKKFGQDFRALIKTEINAGYRILPADQLPSRSS